MTFSDALKNIRDAYAVKKILILFLSNGIVFLAVFAGCVLQISFGVDVWSLFIVIGLVAVAVYILQGYAPFSFVKRPTVFTPYQAANSGLISFTFPVFLCTFLCVTAVFTSAESSAEIAEYNKEFSMWLLSSQLLAGTPIQKYAVLGTAQIVTYVIPWAAAVLLSIMAFPLLAIFAIVERRRVDNRKGTARDYFNIACALMTAYIVYDAGFAGMEIIVDGAPKPIQTASGPAYVVAPETYFGFGDYYDETDLIKFSIEGLIYSAFLVCFLPVMLAIGAASTASLLQKRA